MAAITRIWILLNLITMLGLVYLQIPYPMYPHIGPPMQPMFGMLPPPMPLPIPMPVPIAIRIEQTSTTSTTTTEQSIAMAVPIPLPMPIHVAVPAMAPPVNCQRRPRPYNCPPCPPCLCAPSCTPAFFAYCSPCHQKCKCHSLAPPIYKKKYYRESSCSDDSSSSASSSSSEWVSARRRMRRRGKRKSLRNLRRNFQISDMETSGGELVKPVLTYISKNGDIKLKKRISSDEAAQLLGDRRRPKTHQNVKIIGEEDNHSKSQVILISNDAKQTFNENKRRQVVLRDGTVQHILEEGKKELIFRPPDNKKISNLSVSFQVVR